MLNFCAIGEAPCDFHRDVTVEQQANIYEGFKLQRGFFVAY